MKRLLNLRNCGLALAICLLVAMPVLATETDGGTVDGEPVAADAATADVAGAAADAATADVAGATETGTPLSTFFANNLTGNQAGSQTGSESASRESVSMSTGAMVTRVVLGLGLVLGLLGAVLFLYKKATLGRPSGLGGSGIQILSSRGVGQKSQLAVVRVGGETLLIGMTPNQITTLSRLNSGGAETGAPAIDPAGESTSRQANHSRYEMQTATAMAANDLSNDLTGRGKGFEQTLAGEVKRVRDTLWTSLKRLES